MKTLKNWKTGLLSLGLALMAPGAAFAQTTSLADTVEPKITEMVTDVTSVAGIVVLVVLAVVGARVVFGMLKRPKIQPQPGPGCKQGRFSFKRVPR